MLKKIGLIGGGVIAAILFLVGAAFATDAIQRQQDRRVLNQFVQSESALQAFRGKPAEKTQVICAPAGSKGDYCPALLYKIDRPTCTELVKRYNPSKTGCYDDTSVTYKGRSIIVRTGEVYGRGSDVYLQVIMNEANLF